MIFCINKKYKAALDTLLNKHMFLEFSILEFLYCFSYIKSSLFAVWDSNFRFKLNHDI